MAIRKGTVGFQFVFRIKHLKANGQIEYPAIADVNDVKIVFVKPQGSESPAVFVQPYFLTDGTDGWVAWHTLTRSDLSINGRWQAWAFLDIEGYNGVSDPYDFEVADVPFTLPAVP